MSDLTRVLTAEDITACGFDLETERAKVLALHRAYAEYVVSGRDKRVAARRRGETVHVLTYDEWWRAQ